MWVDVYSFDPPLKEICVLRTVAWPKWPGGLRERLEPPFYYLNDPNLVNLELREWPSCPGPVPLMVGRNCRRYVHAWVMCACMWCNVRLSLPSGVVCASRASLVTWSERYTRRGGGASVVACSSPLSNLYGTLHHMTTK